MQQRGGSDNGGGEVGSGVGVGGGGSGSGGSVGWYWCWFWCCSREIGVARMFASHRAAERIPLTSPRVVDPRLYSLFHSFLFFPFCLLTRFSHTEYSRDGRVCYAHDGRAFREESSRPTDPPTMAAVPLGVEGSTRERGNATRRDAGVAVTHYQRKREERAEERVGVMRYVSPASCGWMGERR